MDDESYNASRIDKPFSFFGRSFTRAQVYRFGYEECEHWLKMCRQTMFENKSYRDRMEALGDPIRGEDLAKKISFDVALSKFVYMLEDRQHRLGASKLKLFFEIAQDELDPVDFDRIVNYADEELADMEYESPDQLSFLSEV